jgi:hypothetical protein
MDLEAWKAFHYGKGRRKRREIGKKGAPRRRDALPKSY